MNKIQKAIAKLFKIDTYKPLPDAIVFKTTHVPLVKLSAACDVRGDLVRYSPEDADEYARREIAYKMAQGLGEYIHYKCEKDDFRDSYIFMGTIKVAKDEVSE